MGSSFLSAVLPSRFASERHWPLRLSGPTRLSPHQQCPQRWQAHLQALLSQCDTLQQHWQDEAQAHLCQADPALADQLQCYPRTLKRVNRRLTALKAHGDAAAATSASQWPSEATLAQSLQLARAELIELNQALQAGRRSRGQAPWLLTARLMAWGLVTLATLTSLLLTVSSGTGLLASASMLSVVTVGLSLSARFLQDGLTLHELTAAWQARGWTATARLDQRLAALQTLVNSLITSLTDTFPEISPGIYAEPWCLTEPATQRETFLGQRGWPYA